MRIICIVMMLLVNLQAQGDMRPLMRIVATDIVQHSQRSSRLENVIRRSFDDLGYASVFVYQPGNRGGFESERGSFDGDLIRLGFYQQHTKNLIRVPAPLYQVELVAVGSASENLSVTKETLRNFRLTCPMGSLYSKVYCEPSPYYIEAKSIQQMVQLVKLGRSQLLIAPKVIADVFVGHDSSLVIHQPAIEVVLGYFYIHKRHEKLVPELAERISHYARETATYP